MQKARILSGPGLQGIQHSLSALVPRRPAWRGAGRVGVTSSHRRGERVMNGGLAMHQAPVKDAGLDR